MSAVWQDMVRTVLVGVGATAVLDLWMLALARVGVPFTNFSMIGRWAGHLARGRIAHESIASADAIRGELGLGWLTHYLIGIAFAGVLVWLQGVGWLRHPAFLPAVLFGASTAVVPLFIVQPLLGAGFAASKTPAPWAIRLRTALNHGVFGSGLFLAAAFAAWARP